MSSQWQYQIRVHLTDQFADMARSDPANPGLKLVTDILLKHHATMKCQLDAFAEYVAEAETRGVADFPLYKWTKVTIEDPARKEKHRKSFTLHVDGNEVYSEEVADALESDLRPLVSDGFVTRLSKQNTNPADNIPIPPQFR